MRLTLECSASDVGIGLAVSRCRSGDHRWEWTLILGNVLVTLGLGRRWSIPRRRGR